MEESRGAPPNATGSAPPERSMTRLYVGNLPNDVERRDVEQLFSKYGTILDVSVKRTVSGAPFAFIEFDNERDVQDAISGRDGYNFNGHRLRVEVPFASRGGPPRGGRGGGGGFRGGSSAGRGGGMGTPRRGEFRVLISGLPPSGSWQDLKDHMRDAGDCVFADVFRDGNGVVEFGRREDVEYAMRYFNDSKFRSHEGESSRITLRIPDDRRRSPSPYMGGGGGRYDSRGGGRGGYPDDSGAPPRYEDAPARHDDYRGGGGGRGGGGPYYEDRPIRRRSMSPPPYGGGGSGGGYRGARGPSRSRSRSRSR